MGFERRRMRKGRKVSLFVRLWVEIHRSCRNSNPGSCQPLREAVSWNMTGDYMVAVQEGQPLREAVSWNSLCQRNLTEKVGSASSWGCELKYYSLIITGKCFTVSLFVRLWVEMYDRGWNDALEKSASSWGCELKWMVSGSLKSNHRQPLREAVSWNAVSAER